MEGRRLSGGDCGARGVHHRDAETRRHTEAARCRRLSGGPCGRSASGRPGRTGSGSTKQVSLDRRSLVSWTPILFVAARSAAPQGPCRSLVAQDDRQTRRLCSSLRSSVSPRLCGKKLCASVPSSPQPPLLNLLSSPSHLSSRRHFSASRYPVRLLLRATASDSITTPQAASATASGHNRSRPIPFRKIPRTITR